MCDLSKCYGCPLDGNCRTQSETIREAQDRERWRREKQRREDEYEMATDGKLDYGYGR